MERKLLPALRKMKDDIHVVGNISDGFDEKAMKYFPKKQKGLHVQSLNELKSLSHNPNVPEDCSDDFEIHHVKMVEFLYIYMSGFFPKLTVLWKNKHRQHIPMLLKNAFLVWLAKTKQNNNNKKINKQSQFSISELGNVVHYVSEDTYW